MPAMFGPLWLLHLKQAKQRFWDTDAPFIFSGITWSISKVTGSKSCGI